MTFELEKVTTQELMKSASKLRDAQFGNTITYSPKVFIPLTTLCRNNCSYCTFVKHPKDIDNFFLSKEQIREIIEKGLNANCHEALFTLGERPERKWKGAKAALLQLGYDSTVDYLTEISKYALEELGILTHINAGALYANELSKLREVSVSQGMMLESINNDLECHRGSPDKIVSRRLSTLDAAGQLQIPFTTGLLVGIGDSESDRIHALLKIRDLHEQYGHIQEVIIQNFLPKPSTQMSMHQPCDTDSHLRTIALARIILPLSIHLQAPPNLSTYLSSLLAAGIDDFGGISPITIDHVNPEMPWPEIDLLRKNISDLGFDLVARLAIHPEWANAPTQWLSPLAQQGVLNHSDALGFAREDNWVSGGVYQPPFLRGATIGSSNGSHPTLYRQRTQIDEILDGVALSQELDEIQIEALFHARGTMVDKISEVANSLRSEIVGETITYVKNRNINYTNICTFKCKFCAFSKGPLSLNLRGTPYLLSFDELAAKVTQAVNFGATEVCLQGGIHPSFDGNYYLNVIKLVRSVAPNIHIHGFTALEISEGARRLSVDIPQYLALLKGAGLNTLPGTSAEILDDKVRAILCPDKIDSNTWLGVHQHAHEIGLKSNVTIMFGAVESPSSWAKHLVDTRALQKKTRGFTEFVPLPFVHMASPIYLQKKARKGPTFRETRLMHSIARLVYRDTIQNIQVSWVKMGMSGAKAMLESGANDLGGTLIEENISRSAGALHGQTLDQSMFEEIARDLNRPLQQRTTLYQAVKINV